MNNYLPLNYEYINTGTSMSSPSTMHARGTGISRFFERHLFQKAVSVFEWKLPETWNRDYFLYTLYAWGVIGVVNTDKFGVICQGCTLKGYDIYYAPTHMMITNPLLTGILEPRIGVQGELFKLQPDYCGIIDLTSYYADMLAICHETIASNIVNSKLSWVFSVSNKNLAESMKKMYDQIASGEPAVFLDKDARGINGEAPWEAFSQNVSQNYIASDVISDMRRIEAMFDTDIGIPNTNVDKRERLITSEVESNNVDTASKAELWLESLKASAKRVNAMFGLNISVDWRHKPDVNEDETRGLAAEDGV